jgi:sulfane dehydrogenase subunit SoxC
MPNPITPLSAAGNGLMHRRLFLKAGAGLVGGSALLTAQPAAATRAAWMKAPGRPMSGYGSPSEYEAGVERIGFGLSQPGTTGSGASRTPLEHLNGVITPSGLHFERHHSGIPDIDPDRFELMIHGLVERPLKFSMESLTRYPMVTRTQFLECSGNSRALLNQTAAPQGCGEIHGLISASEWTGVPLSILLDEAGVSADARWLVAEGGDAAMMSRSVPLAKAFDDALLALYQNGERLRPENGYPVRLFLPGYEGNMSVKWLRRIAVTAQPAMTRDETSKYTDLQPDGTARMFTFEMAVKSVITSPSPGLVMHEPGLYQISGIAWSGRGKIARVEVSADGGKSWAEAALDEPVLSKCLTRFRSAWRWDGGPSSLLSRAIDEAGEVQPTRTAYFENNGPSTNYHCNMIQAWQVASTGDVANVYG